MTNPTLERAARAAGDVAANMHEDVRHVLSPAAIERVARAVLLAVRGEDIEFLLTDPGAVGDVHPGLNEGWRAGIDAILRGGE